MASITDCVVEGLKYPFNDIKRLLGFGVLFALLNGISVFASFKSLDVFRFTVHAVEKTNTTLSHLSLSHLPTGDVYLLAGLAIISFIVLLFIMGYQYNVVEFSIAKKEDLPGFADILDMIVKGIKYFVVVLAYNIIPALILIGGVTLVGDSQALGVITIISMALFVIVYFFLIMGLNNMVAHNSIKKAFDFKQIKGNISNLGWGKYIGIIIFTVIVYVIIMAAVHFILAIITVMFAATISNQALIVSFVISLIEGLIVSSYGEVFFNRVCGSIYRESVK